MLDTSLEFYAGRYKGRPVDEAPSSYLRWAALNWTERTEGDKELMRAVNAELAFRDKFNSHF